MSRILLVSKPVAPPWNDSSKNLVRDLALNMSRHTPTVLSRRGASPRLAGVRIAPIYPDRPGRYAPALADNARVALRLLTGLGADLWHFFFAPNPRSSSVARLAAALRRKKSIQTVCSAPAPGADLSRVLFADRVVVLSRHTEQRFLDRGVAADRLRRIPPAVGSLAPLTAAQQANTRARLGLPADRHLLVYPGDLEFGTGADRAIAALAALPTAADAHLVMACRAKTGRALECERNLKETAEQRGLAPRVTWLGETPEIRNLLGCADLVLLPTEDLYAKMDLPLVLLEAMSLGRPVLVAENTSAAELADDGAAIAVDPSDESLAAAALDLLNDGDRRRRIGDRARRAVTERFGPLQMAAAYEQLYDELLAD
jgi:phosphatidylinositol alpha-1,6-mannosyltransferase